MKKPGKGYLYKKGRFYYLQYTLDGKRKKQVLKDSSGKKVTNKTEAEKVRQQILEPILKQDKIKDLIKLAQEDVKESAKKADELLNPALTFDTAWEAYVLNQKRPQSGERTLKGYKGHFVAFKKWMQENYPKIKTLKNVTDEIAQQYAHFLKQNFSSGTFNKHRDFLKIFFHYLKKKIKSEHNPFSEIRRLKNIQNSRRELTIPELQKVLDTAPNDLKLIFQIAAFTGLRLGDICTLQWNEIDLVKRIIKRIPNKTSHMQKAVTIGIPNILYEQLINFPPTERTGYLMPGIANKYQNGGQPNISKAIQKHFEACGIKTKKENTGGKGSGKRAVTVVGLHSLRHTYISLLARQGVSQNVLVKQAGHSERMSEHYTHLDSKIIESNALILESKINNKIIDITPISEETQLLEKITKAIEFINKSDIDLKIKDKLNKILTQ